MFQVSSNLLRHFKGYCSSPSVILMFVYMKFRFSLSYRELEEMMSMRGATVDHSTLQRWVRRFSSLIDTQIRKRKKPVGGSWRMDETYIKLNGKWVYLYRAVDKEGHTVDFLLRAKRNKPAAKAFFKKALKAHGVPDKINIDKSGTNKAAIESLKEDLSHASQIEIRQNAYLNNLVEQEHRFVKKRTRPTLGFKNFHSAKATIAGIENIRIIQKGQIYGHNPALSTFHNFAALMA